MLTLAPMTQRQHLSVTKHFYDDGLARSECGARASSARSLSTRARETAILPSLSADDLAGPPKSSSSQDAALANSLPSGR